MVESVLSDALTEYHSVTQKTMKLYKTFFFHFVDIAVVNSYLLKRDLVLSTNKKSMTQKKFRKQLCSQLAVIGVENEKGNVGEQEEQE